MLPLATFQDAELTGSRSPPRRDVSMDRSRLTRAAAAASTKGGGLFKTAADPVGNARRRLIAYLIAIAVLGGAIVLYDPPERAPEIVARDADADLPVRPPHEALVEIDRARLAAVRDATPTARALLERDARLHLLEQSSRLIWGDLQRLGLQRGDWQQLMDDPASQRGDAVWAIGRLKWFETETLDGLFEVRGEIEDERGRSWGFLVAAEPYGAERGARQPTPIEVGEVVRVEGFFFKVADLARPDRSVVTAPLIVGRDLNRSMFRMEPVTELTDDQVARIASIDDRTLGLAEQPLETPEFYELLSYVKHAPRERLFAEEPVEVTPDMLLKSPARWRARPVRVTGVLVAAKQEELGLGGENPLGEPFIWELWASDNRAGELGTVGILAFDLPEGLRPGTIVEADGLFFRRQAYETRENKAHMASIILAREVWEFVPPPDTLTPIMVKIVGGLVGVVILLIVLANWRDRRASLDQRSKRMKRHQRNAALPGVLHGNADEAVLAGVGVPLALSPRRRADGERDAGEGDDAPADAPRDDAADDDDAS